MAIDYNADVLPLYAKLYPDAEFVQELASQSSRGFDTSDESVGAGNEQILINTVAITVSGTVPVSGDASLDDWLTAIQAAVGFTGATPDMEAAIITQQNGQQVLVIVAVDDGSPVDITTADGTPNGLPSLGMPAATVLGGGDLQTGRADQKNEQRLLTTLGVLTAHLRLLGNRTESRNLHFILSRIATAVGSGGFVYRDKEASVTGNVKNPTFVATADRIVLEAINEGEDSSIGTGTITLSTGTTLDDAIIDINVGLLAAGIDVEVMEAINDGGYLKLVSQKGWSIFVNQFGTATEVANKAGIEFGTYQNTVSRVASDVETEALRYFDTNRRKLNL